MKKLISVLLLFCFLLSAVACAGESDVNGESNTNGKSSEIGESDENEGTFGTTVPGETTTAGVIDGTTTAPASVTTDYLDTIPDVDFKEAEFRILCTSQTEYFYNNFEQSADIVQNAVYQRNLAVSEKYKVDVRYSSMNGNSNGASDFASHVRVSTQGADNEGYDLILAQSYYILPLALDGCLYDLMESDYIHWDGDWYHQKINDNGVINEKLYGASGSFVMSQISYAMGVYFNKQMFKDYYQDASLYDLVRTGEWTYAKLLEYCSTVYQDLNPNNYPDADDLFGFVYHQHAYNTAIVASDCPITSVGTDGEPTFMNYYNDHLVKVFASYHDFFNNYKAVFYNNGDYVPLVMLANEKTMFAAAQIGGMNDCQELRASTVKYGILPFPKYDSAQKEYYTYTMRWELFYVPTNADFDNSCILLEYLNYTSNEIMIPAYWEMALGIKSADTVDDNEMLDYIRDSLYYDFSTFYSSQLNNIRDGVANQLKIVSNRLTAWWNGNKASFETKLDELLNAYQ